ncbi:MAG: mercuric transporter MerT family protein [Janthinobacterium lividum]
MPSLPGRPAAEAFDPLPQPQGDRDPARSRLSLGLVALGLLSTLLASTCCVLPLVLVLLGIGGAWMVNLTAMAPVTPVFIVIALAALGWAGYLLFRPAAGCTYPQADDCTRRRRFSRRVFVVSAGLIALLLLFPLLAPIFY